MGPEYLLYLLCALRMGKQPKLQDPKDYKLTAKIDDRSLEDLPGAYLRRRFVPSMGGVRDERRHCP